MRLLILLFGGLLATTIQAADQVAPVLFSHFYVDLDKETYHALQESSEILSFADHELAHKSDGHSEYTGYYLRGRHTYMEFFGDPIPDGDRLGNVGLGFWVEKAGEVGVVNARLQRAFGTRAKVSSTTYPIDSGTVPWYTAAYVDENRSDDSENARWIASGDNAIAPCRRDPGV